MIGDATLLAVRELRRNLLRAVLTTVGIVMGVCSVIALVTLGNGVMASMTDTVARLGHNLIFLTAEVPTGSVVNIGPDSKPRPFSEADVAAIRREVGHLRGVSPEAQKTVFAIAGNRNHNTPVTGATGDFLVVHDYAVASGRSFNDLEIRAGRTACLLGETVRQALFGASDPLGAHIRLGNVPCEVIGVLAPKGQSTFGQDQDDLLLMPLRAEQRRLAGNSSIAAIWLSAETAEDVPRIVSDLKLLMRERRRILPGMADDFTLNDLGTVTEIIGQITLGMTLFVAVIGIVSLVVGGIGIMNIMLVSITERTREIGIRLAIGAREAEVLLQFLVEATMISALGGVIGILIGLGIAGTASLVIDLPFRPSLLIVMGTFLFSAFIGISFGYLPARRAARLDPIEALRHE